MLFFTEIDRKMIGSYTSLSWPFCHSKENDDQMQEKANIYFDYSQNSDLTKSNERKYCNKFHPNGTIYLSST